jgi:hypothetical protein
MSADSSLGAYLRGCRERSGLSVEAVSAGSRILPRLVDAVEGDRRDLPAPGYVRGFIRPCWDQVAADTAEALRTYKAQAAPAPPVSVQAASPPLWTSSTQRRWRRLAAGTLLVAALGATAAVVLGRRQLDAGASRSAGGGPRERVLVMRATDTTWVHVQADGAGPAEEVPALGAPGQVVRDATVPGEPQP